MILLLYTLVVILATPSFMMWVWPGESLKGLKCIYSAIMALTPVCTLRRAASALPLLPRRYSAASVGFAPEELEKLEAGLGKFKSLKGRLSLPGSDGRPPERRALSLMVGWAASNPKVMSKYASIYTKLGIPCLSIAPGVRFIWSSRLANAQTQNVLSSVESSLKEPASLLLHLFSGGSSVVLPKITEDYSDPSSMLCTRFPLACVVFDSGPANFSFESGTAAARLSYELGAYNYFTYLLASATGIISEKLIGARKRLELKKSMASDVLDIPQLYLHSEEDSVSPSSWVNAVVGEQKERGRDVSSFCWIDSEHVRHYLHHPEEYEEQVSTFLKKCNIIGR